ncbi:Protein of unknown function (Porph_ging) [Elizabethkingia miricola]|nr:Protein of unknown function (Porph_ging) [Elizabethkingia miricola]
MKKIYVLLFISMAFVLSAQNYRAIYELKFKPNKDKDSVITDYYALDLFPKLEKTSFYNHSYYKNDSIMDALSEKSEREGGVNIDLNSLPKAKYPLVYIKENGKKYSFKTIDGDSYKFSDESKMTWKILKESKKIKSWNCQKAETEYLGRKWTAWFTTDLLFPEGPYKFSGLPGLIVEVSDEKNDFRFALEAIYKNAEKVYLPSAYEKSIVVDKSKYEKALSNYIKDPGVKLRQGTMVDESGNQFQIAGGFSKDFIDQAVAERRKKMKEFNNLLD